MATYHHITMGSGSINCLVDDNGIRVRYLNSTITHGNENDSNINLFYITHLIVSD